MLQKITINGNIPPMYEFDRYDRPELGEPYLTDNELVRRETGEKPNRKKRIILKLKPWPNDGDLVWCFDMSQRVTSFEFVSGYHRESFNFGNYFSTQEDAEKALKECVKICKSMGKNNK
jgi:hypothetical protein